MCRMTWISRPVTCTLFDCWRGFSLVCPSSSEAAASVMLLTWRDLDREGLQQLLDLKVVMVTTLGTECEGSTEVNI